MANLSNIELVYRSESGEEYTQPLADITEAGTLIDPETGDDMELVRWQFAGAQDYVIVEGGVVQNNPGLPVFDLDQLEDDDNAQGALELHNRLVTHGQAAQDWSSAVQKARTIVEIHGTPEDMHDLLPFTLNQ